MSENNYFKVNESTKKLSEIAVENIKKEFPELPSKTEEEIRLIVSLADIYDTRLVVGTCIICSNAEIVKSKSFTNRKTESKDDFGLKLTETVIDRAWGVVHAQQKLELCHKDINFSPVFEKCSVCGKCEPEIENNEWQGYDSNYIVGDGYGLSKDKAYMICTKGGGYIYPTDDGQKSIMHEYALWANEQPPKVETVSAEYIDFLIKYEKLGDTWKYAQDLDDGTVTISYGVVILERNGNYPFGEDVYKEFIRRRDEKIPLTEDEARTLMQMKLDEKVEIVLNAAEENNWNLSQNQLDALVDMVWNIKPEALEYNASRLIATGDLSDSSVKQSLEKEMLETATYVKNGEKTWAKNLAERRLDIVRIAAGEEEAYEKHEFSAQWWNQNGRDLLIESGIPADIVNKYPIQEAKEY